MQYKDVTPIIAELVRLKNSIPLEVDIGRYLPEVRKNIHGEAVRSGLKKALRVIEQAPAVASMPRWISVEDEPPKNVYLQVYVAKFGYVEKAKYEGLLWRTSGGESLNIDWVTHWMHLPEPPKEE